MLHHARHENIVEYYGYCFDNEDISSSIVPNLIMELMEQSLDDCK